MAITGELGGEAPISTAPSGGSYGDDSEATGARDRVNPVMAVQPSKLPASQLCDVLKGWWKADAQHSTNWRTNCEQWFGFRAGDQWTPEDRELLNAQQRPHIVFNRILTVLKAVAGMEINGRHEITFIPRNVRDTNVNEVLTAASKWMADNCDAEDEESSAFEDACTVGMGWCENRVTYEFDPAGMYIEEKVDPKEMFWDRTCTRKNLEGARRMHRVRKMILGDVMQMFPGKTRTQLDATWAIGSEISEASKTLEEKRRREANTNNAIYDDRVEVTIVQTQWWEREEYWIVANLENNTKVQLSDQEYRFLQVRMKLLGKDSATKAVKMYRRVYKQAFIGNEILDVGDAPLKDQFSWKCITGELDHNKGVWFGLVHIMEDPQRWANKWLSQSLHIMNTTAKGGILAEEDAFEDVREAEDNYARPDAITWVKKGALSGASPKLMPKPGQGFPQGHMQLMEFAISAIRDVTGINLELLGLKDQNQPGVLEAYRKQAGMTVLATLFDSLRRFRKQTGRARLYFIQNFLADGRLIRVVSPEGAQAIPLLKDKCLGEYDTIVDDTPTSPNMKEANWAIIQPMLAIFKDQLIGNPQILVMLLEYSPLPNRVVEALKAIVAQQQQDPEQQQMKQLVIAGKVAAINKDQSTAEMQNAKAGASQATALYDIAIAKKHLEENDLGGLAAHLENMKKAAEVRKTHAETLKTIAEMQGGGPTNPLGDHLDNIQRAHDIRKTQAEIQGQHADTLATLIDALTPQQPAQAA